MDSAEGMALPHRNGSNLVFFEIGNSFEELIGKGSEGTDVLIFNTDEDRFRADIDTGRVGVDGMEV